MNLQEFKAWFEGYTEQMPGRPSEDQWDRIKARIKEIDGSTTTEKIFVDRYLPSVPLYGIFNGGSRGIPVPNWQGSHLQCYNSSSHSGHSASEIPSWNSTNAFNTLGKAEAAVC